MPRRVLALLLTCLAAPACRWGSRGDPPSPLKIETRRFEKLLPGCGDQSKREQPCVSFRVEWPEVVEAPTPEAKMRINAAVGAVLRPKDGPMEFGDEARQMIEDYQRFRREASDEAVTYFVRRAAWVLRSTGTLLSIEVNQESFTGGAHPNASRSYLNLRPETGEEIRLDTVLAPGARGRLEAAAERRFRSARSVAPDQSLADAGFTFPDNRFVLSQRWGATPTGMVFHYDAYEIGPYVLGPTTLDLPWSEAATFLTPEAGLAPRK